MTLAAIETRTVPLDRCIKVTGMTGRSAGDPVRVAGGAGPAASGKSVLLRSWIDEAGLAEHAAQVSVQDEDHDPQRFWTSVTDALRDTAAGSALIQPLTATPD